MGGAPREIGASRGIQLREQWHDATAEEVASEALVGVRFILDPLETAAARVAFDLRAGHAEQRTQQRRRPLITAGTGRRHAREPCEPRAAQELQQDGLSLIVLMLGEHDEIGARPGERGIPRRSRRAFDAETAVRREICRPHGAAQAVAPRGRARKAPPPARVGAESVVDVQALEGKRMRGRKPGQNVEGNDRVDAARERERQPRAARNVARELRCDALAGLTLSPLP